MRRDVGVWMGHAWSNLALTNKTTFLCIISVPWWCGTHCLHQEFHSVLLCCCPFVHHSEWNPKTDKHLPHNYDVEDFVEGKRRNKMKLQVRDGWG